MEKLYIFCLCIGLSIAAQGQNVNVVDPVRASIIDWIPTPPNTILPPYRLSAQGDTLDLEKLDSAFALMSNTGSIISEAHRYVKRDDMPIILKYSQYRAMIRRIERLEKGQKNNRD
ncbi:hypothetical protein [Spirosoma flavum]|uniref:Uncharacterized protein n=1 Tax=Spirosoma flavum TaxID=2048557 RepID=A0ABW6AQV8_9BACT